MVKKFLKLNLDNDEAEHLASKHPNAFILLFFIAKRARRISGHSDGLCIGEAKIGDWENMGLSRQNYRTALKVLTTYKFVQILETNRTRKNSTTGSTTEGTKVKILNSVIWDINSEAPNQQSNHCLTTAQPLPNHEEEGRRRNKKDHPSIPSYEEKFETQGPRMTDDFSSKGEEEIEIVVGVFLSPEDLEACIAIKGSKEKVSEAIGLIQASPKRKYPIADWPNTLATWKIQDSAKGRIKEHIVYTEKLCREFESFEQGDGWRCRMYNDPRKDVRGILFESQSAYQEAFFVALADGELKDKCENFISQNGMRVKQNC